ncbi:hypothetical protein D3C81_1789470 [compost metagenome]
MHVRPGKQVVCLELLCRGFEHRRGGVNGHEAPIRFQPGHRNDFLGRAARANHQYVCRSGGAQAGRQHARGQIVAGVIACQRDAALSGVLVGPGGIEFFSGVGRGYFQGDSPCRRIKLRPPKR